MKLKQIMNNFHSIAITGDKIIFFSYETPIGFICHDQSFVSENKWGRTTGKHISWFKAYARAGGDPVAKEVPHQDLLDLINLEIY